MKACFLRKDLISMFQTHEMTHGNPLLVLCMQELSPCDYAMPVPLKEILL